MARRSRKSTQKLTADVSGQIASFLGLEAWPCPKCDIGATKIMVSARGIAAEKNRFLLNVQKNEDGGGFKALLAKPSGGLLAATRRKKAGLGSLPQPTKPLATTKQTGEEMLAHMKKVFDPDMESTWENFLEWSS